MKVHCSRKKNQSPEELKQELLGLRIALAQLAMVLAFEPMLALEAFPRSRPLLALKVYPRSRLMHLGSFLCF